MIRIDDRQEHVQLSTSFGINTHVDIGITDAGAVAASLDSSATGSMAGIGTAAIDELGR